MTPGCCRQQVRHGRQPWASCLVTPRCHVQPMTQGFEYSSLLLSSRCFGAMVCSSCLFECLRYVSGRLTCQLRQINSQRQQGRHRCWVHRRPPTQGSQQGRCQPCGLAGAAALPQLPCMSQITSSHIQVLQIASKPIHLKIRRPESCRHLLQGMISPLADAFGAAASVERGEPQPSEEHVSSTAAPWPSSCKQCQLCVLSCT